MNATDILKLQFLATVKEQLESGNPQETTHTFQRLQAEGFTAEEAQLLIAQCVALEFVDSIQRDMPFNQKRYVNNLNALPAPPTSSIPSM